MSLIFRHCTKSRFFFAHQRYSFSEELGFEGHSLNGTLTETLKQIIADLMHSAGKQITVQCVNVQYQKGSQDCGLFAIAFACEICFGKDPSSVKFVQSTMRQHLIEGLEQGNILPFPSAVRRQRSQVVRQEVFKIFCSCRMPADQFSTQRNLLYSGFIFCYYSGFM